MNSKNKQKFMQIPFMQLIKNIINKSSRYGIKIKIIDEAYTSKTSVLSRNIIELRRCFNEFPMLMSILKKDSTLSANVFKGIRAKRSKIGSKGDRGLFYDELKNVFINSDLNGAANICAIAKQAKLVSYNYHKLCNPIKCKSDGELLGLLCNNLRIERTA